MLLVKFSLIFLLLDLLCWRRRGRCSYDCITNSLLILSYLNWRRCRLLLRNLIFGSLIATFSCCRGIVSSFKNYLLLLLLGQFLLLFVSQLLWFDDFNAWLRLYLRILALINYGLLLFSVFFVGALFWLGNLMLLLWWSRIDRCFCRLNLNIILDLLLLLGRWYLLTLLILLSRGLRFWSGRCSSRNTCASWSL